MQFFVSYFCQGRVHHEDKADSDGYIRRAYLKRVDEPLDARVEVAAHDANEHSQEYPQGQESIKKGKLFHCHNIYSRFIICMKFRNAGNWFWCYLCFPFLDCTFSRRLIHKIFLIGIIILTRVCNKINNENGEIDVIYSSRRLLFTEFVIWTYFRRE